MEDIDEENKIEILEALQDLYHGYAVVLKNRNWCAQSLLPICPELVFCEATPNEKNRKKLVKFDVNPTSVDTYLDGSHISSYAKGAMEWAVGSAIITGKDNATRLAPLENTARAECAVIFMRFMEKYN